MITLNFCVTRFLSLQPLPMFVGGRWIEAREGRTFAVRDPGTGAIIARVAAGGVVEGVDPKGQGVLCLLTRPSEFRAP